MLRSSAGVATWSSGTAGAGARADMLWNGNLVVVDTADAVVFETGTSTLQGAYAILHDGGVLAVYWQGALVWSSS